VAAGRRRCFDAGPAGGKPASGDLSAERLLDMVYFPLYGSAPLVERDARLARLRADPARRDELRQLADVLRERIHRVTAPPVGRVPR
jgi:hypothetical protein